MQNGDIFSFQLLNIVKTMCKQQHSLQRSWQKYNKIAWTVILLHLLHFAWQECKSNIHILLWFLLRHHMKNWATDINKSGTVEENGSQQLPHSAEVEESNPAPAFLCGVCIFLVLSCGMTPCEIEISPEIIQKLQNCIAQSAKCYNNPCQFYLKKMCYTSRKVHSSLYRFAPSVQLPHP